MTGAKLDRRLHRLFESKICYGSDRFMPSAARDRTEALGAWRTIFADEALLPHHRAFFARNRWSYRNAAKRKNDERLPPSVQDSLNALASSMESGARQ